MSARSGLLHVAGLLVIGSLSLMAKVGSHSGGLVRAGMHESGAIGRALEHNADGVTRVLSGTDDAAVLGLADDVAAGADDAGRGAGRPHGSTDHNIGVGAGRAPPPFPRSPLHDGDFLMPEPPARGSMFASDHPLSQFGTQLANSADINRAKPASYEVFIVAPRNQSEAKSIFLSSSDPAFANRAVVDADAAVKSLGGSAKRGENAFGMLDAIEHSEQNYISIIGHNQNGKIIFPDGSIVDLRYLSKRCSEWNKFCIMLSCKSKYVGDANAPGMHVRLTYRDAAKISEQIGTMMSKAKLGVISPRQIEKGVHQLLISSDLAIATADTLQIAYIPVGVIGVGAMLISVDPD